MISWPVRGQTPDAPCVGNWTSPRVQWKALGLRTVRLEGFLGRHVDANNRVSLLAGLESPIPAAFDAWAKGQAPPDTCKRLATDSDFYKWLEGACYAVAYEPGLKELAERVDHYADILIRMQEPDGYLGTRLSPAEPFDRKVRHDLYCAGHFIEAAVAHYHATGRRDLLDAAVRLADFYLRAWKDKHPYFEIVGQQEHAEIEVALARLYRATGEPRFLEFGQAVTRMAFVGPTLAETRAGAGSLHAVRLCYLLTGATELHIESGAEDFYRYVPQLWNEIVTTRMYVTGGIGWNERVPVVPYDLPQTLAGETHRDIAETCASVSLMMLSWRLHAIDGDPRRFDTIETVLYNHYLGAISQDHLGNFYYNPLRRTGDLTGRTDHSSHPVQRCRLPKIHSTACCMPNAWRFFGQLPEYVFSRNGDELRVNLYTDATTSYRLTDGTPVKIEMTTKYPHDGRVTIRVAPAQERSFAISVRIPWWCDQASVKLDGRAERVTAGYHRLQRAWKPGDVVELDLPMRPVVLTSHPAVTANAGQVALRRGPLVYCLERQDCAGLEPENVALVLNASRPESIIREDFDAEHGHWVLSLPARRREAPATTQAALYEPVPAASTDLIQVSMIPFYFRANRQEDTRWMTWIPYESR
ncbi:MAG TPA: glycoside hydrolase family 127 protein [Phycisphaerae bacterium]|nr:glycoside hydrolase family 127 protein [Phycisphaerae bacterium]HPU27417.1 glycoside hydrolase family 127 protein [Phycisphaerae bacterium]